MYVLAPRRSNDRTFLYGYPTCVVSKLQITGITRVAGGFSAAKSEVFEAYCMSRNFS